MEIIENIPKIAVPFDTIIWRYLKIEKFKDLIENKRIFFSRTDLFEDIFEGSVPKREVDYRPIESVKISYFNNKPMTLKEAQARDNAMSETHKAFRRSYIVSCWHMNENKSEAMWKLYLNQDKGVAIKSTVGQLLNSLNENDFQFIDSKVRYIDYEKDIWFDPVEYPIKAYNMFAPFVHKRKSLKHENEFRILHNVPDAYSDANYWEKQINTKGKFFKIDLQNLLSEIIISPFVDEKFIDDIISILHEVSGLPNPKKSDLLKQPYF